MDKAFIKVTVENPGDITRKQVVDDLVETELNDFDKWITTTFNGTDHLASFERGLLKSYIMHKLEKQMQEIPT